MKRNVVKKWLRVSSYEDISVEAGRMAIDNKRLQMMGQPSTMKRVLPRREGTYWLAHSHPHSSQA